tara:strand:+ start:245 stop:412 length:168 start_codon:yes stop_codon:yes gene_type:complete
MQIIRLYEHNSKETFKLKVISKDKISYYYRLHHVNDAIGLYDNSMNLIKVIKGEI